jgi:hypothetical protein
MHRKLHDLTLLIEVKLWWCTWNIKQIFSTSLRNLIDKRWETKIKPISMNYHFYGLCYLNEMFLECSRISLVKITFQPDSLSFWLGVMTYRCTSGGYPCLFARPSIKSHSNCIPHVIFLESRFDFFTSINFVSSDRATTPLLGKFLAKYSILINKIFYTIKQENMNKL